MENKTKFKLGDSVCIVDRGKIRSCVVEQIDVCAFRTALGAKTTTTYTMLYDDVNQFKRPENEVYQYFEEARQSSVKEAQQ
jgi:ribosomal protein S24E